MFLWDWAYGLLIGKPFAASKPLEMMKFPLSPSEVISDGSDLAVYWSQRIYPQSSWIDIQSNSSKFWILGRNVPSNSQQEQTSSPSFFCMIGTPFFFSILAANFFVASPASKVPCGWVSLFSRKSIIVLISKWLKHVVSNGFQLVSVLLLPKKKRSPVPRLQTTVTLRNQDNVARRVKAKLETFLFETFFGGPRSQRVLMGFEVFTNWTSWNVLKLSFCAQIQSEKKLRQRWQVCPPDSPFFESWSPDQTWTLMGNGPANGLKKIISNGRSTVFFFFFFPGWEATQMTVETFLSRPNVAHEAAACAQSGQEWAAVDVRAV